MASVASSGTADRIIARILIRVLRAGSGTPARYSSTFFGATLPLAAETRSPGIVFLIGFSNSVKSSPFDAKGYILLNRGFLFGHAPDIGEARAMPQPLAQLRQVRRRARRIHFH